LTLDIMELQRRYHVNVNALMSQTRAMTVEVEARPRQRAAEAEPRPRQAKTVSMQGSCLEDYITGLTVFLHLTQTRDGLIQLESVTLHRLHDNLA